MMVILQAAIENKTVIDADDMVAYTAYLYRLRHELAVCAYWEALARALSQVSHIRNGTLVSSTIPLRCGN